MSDPFFTFKAGIIDHIQRNNPALFNELVTGYDPDSPYLSFKYIDDVPLENLFTKSGLLDEPETSVRLAKMIHAMSDHRSKAKAWVEAGGSPLMATQRKSTVMEKLTPILGYRHSMIHAVGLDDFPAMTPEQWRVGVNPAMAAASLLRGFADGQLRVWHFRKGNVPNVLMEAFRDPLVEDHMIALLKKQPPVDYITGGVFRNPYWFREALYAFVHFGLTDMVDAVCRSPAFKAQKESAMTVMKSFLNNALQDVEPNLERLVEFFGIRLGVAEHDVQLDRALASMFKDKDRPGQAALNAFLLGRFSALRQAGCIASAAPWLIYVLPTLMGDLQLTGDEQSQLSKALSADATAGRRLMGLLHGDATQTIPFLADLMGHKGLTGLMKDACFTSYQEDLEEHRHQLYYAGVADPLLLKMDIGTLKGAGALHAILDGLYEAYSKVWGKTMSKLEKAMDFDSSDLAVIAQVNELATWAGKALAVEPCSQRASRWFDRLKVPAAQDALLRELPADKQLFQRLDTDMLARKFSSDLGL
jgi:hypothetical protein